MSHADDMLKLVQASAMMEFPQLLKQNGELSKRSGLGNRKQKNELGVEGAIFGHSRMVCFSIEAMVVLGSKFEFGTGQYADNNVPCVPCWNCCIAARTGLRCCL